MYDENLAIDPAEARTLLALLELDLSGGGTENALKYGAWLLKAAKDDGLLVRAGTLLAKENKINLAQAFFKKARRINPRNKYLYLEWGKLSGNLEMFDAAVGLWQEGLRLYPEEQQFRDLIGKAREIESSLNKVSSQ